MMVSTFFALLAALTIFPFSQAKHIPSRRRHHHRRQVTLPGTWEELGCYTDTPGARTLTGVYHVNGTGNTVESCIARCDAANFVYAAVEWGIECFCGNQLQNGGAPANAGDCSMPCSGNSQQTCGNGFRMNLYTNGATPPPPPPPPATIQAVGQYQSKGCWSDSVAARSLPVGMGVPGGPGTMTVEKCVAACREAEYTVSGLEYSAECFCGNAFVNAPHQTSDADCNMACSGNPAQKCGGPNRLNVYEFTEPPVDHWEALGCYTDAVGSRTLSVPMAVPGGVDGESCQTACYNAGYHLAGTEYSVECYCDNQIRNGASAQSPDGCNMACQADPTEFCGGPNRLSLYNFTGTIPTPPPVDEPPPPPPPGGEVQPVNEGLPPGWQYTHCYVDNPRRIMPFQAQDDHTLTAQKCIDKCLTAGYKLAGMEYYYQCFCGDTLINGATLGTEASCNTPCEGNTTQACGGPDRVSVYSSIGEPEILPVPTVKTTDLPGLWQYQYCLTEPGAIRVFPYMNEWPRNNTVDACLNTCARFGYPAAGLEFGKECWCGDVENIAAKGGVQAPEADCTMSCSGDPIHLCGGPERLQLYTWAGALNVWHTPANNGRFEFFVPGVVVPLIATVGLNDKVTFLEKGGTGFPNSTGAYELDLSLVGGPAWEDAWRPMHIKTDVFCSASIILPDKGGRQINIGGWSLDSTFGVRLFTPDGAPGQPSHSDWEEDLNTLKLQRGRWYPTALTIANGSILVVGGETGSNAPAQPNLEILPRPPGGDTVVELDWLLRTDPYNLYPFLFVLPSGHIFVGYYNEARIISEVNFETLTVLPNIPGSVNNFEAGRTYPLEGASMLLPQMAPFTDPVEVLICGGSTPFAGDALDNCVHIAPEVPGAQWVIERMPSKRVMSCIVNLPDGSFVIMNGAHKGVAGFGLAEDPNLTPVLYDPFKPLNQRFTVLASTTIARLYHSEATLLPDATVLVSGSDPQTLNPDGTVKYPEEFRIEIFVPPYLNEGFIQPTFTIIHKDWTYGGSYSITVNLQGSTANMRISLIGASSSTHGNTMGSRNLFPAFTCAGNVCTITAPQNAFVCPPGWFMLFVLDGPTPSHSQWVRIGGDPAALGNWPNFPGFTLPGV